MPSLHDNIETGRFSVKENPRYIIVGQKVVRLVDQNQASGRYTVTWNGRNAQGAGVASGVYLYRMTTSAGFSQTRRITLLK